MTQADIDRNEIIAMAKQAGFPIFGTKINANNPSDQIMADAVTAHYHESAIQFAKLVAAAAASKEREACVKAYEAEADTWKAWPEAGIAKRKGVAAIRARGETTSRGEQQ